MRVRGAKDASVGCQYGNGHRLGPACLRRSAQAPQTPLPPEAPSSAAPDPLPCGISAVHTVTRPPTWRPQPLTLTYLLLSGEATGDELVRAYSWALDESLPNPRAIAPSTLAWSEYLNPRFYAAVGRGTNPPLRSPTSDDDSGRRDGVTRLTRLWAESVLFLAGVTMSAAIVQSRWSAGTLASKYDRLWQAGRLAAEGVLPELARLKLERQVSALSASRMSDEDRLLSLRALFQDAIGALSLSSRVETTQMSAARGKGSFDVTARFGFLPALCSLVGGDLTAVIAYGSSVSSATFADYDLIIVSRRPEATLRRMAGLSPAWRGKELNVGVYSEAELWAMQLLSGDNLAGYGLCLFGGVDVPLKPIEHLLLRNLSFAAVRQRQQLGMIPVALEHPRGHNGDNLHNLFGYFVKIPANVVKGTLGATGQRLAKEYVYRWLYDHCGFDTLGAQQRAESGFPGVALADAAVATGRAMYILNREYGVFRGMATELRSG